MVQLYLTSALQRTLFGQVNSTMPSNFLSDIPPELIDQRGNARQSYTARESLSGGGDYGLKRPARERTIWKDALTQVRNNEGLVLAIGDRVKHTDFGEGMVVNTTGEGARQTAEIRFERVGNKRLLVKVAPIEKL